MTGEEWGDGTSDALVRVALGEEPPDTVVADATVFDAVTGEFTPGRSVWVKDGRIARVVEASESVPPGAETLDASGLTLVPGLMDGHTHTIHLFIPEFVRALIPTGVTSPVIEAMEYGATEGFAGVRLLTDALRDQPLRPFYTAPALCGLTEEEEVSPLPPAELVEGHTAGARRARLDAYTALGPSSCHEPISVEEALEVYHRGYLVMLRHGSIRKDLERLRPLFDMPLDFRRFALVTDSVDPEGLETWGYLDQVVREALELDIPPSVVYRMVSTNVVDHFGLSAHLGYLAPGRWADLVAVPAPEEFRPIFVMVGGKLVFDRGEVLAEPRPVSVPAELLHTVGVDPERALEWAGPPPAPPETGTVRVVEYVSNLVTRETLLSAEEAQEEDLVPVLALEQTRGEQAFWGFLKGLGLREGAYVTATTWDTPDLVVVGRDEVAVRTALQRVTENGGGGVFARGKEVIAESKAPVCAVASLDPAERVRTDLRALAESLQEAGVPWENPLLAVDTLTSPAIPHLRVSHRGYVRLRDRAARSCELYGGSGLHGQQGPVPALRLPVPRNGTVLLPYAQHS